MADRFRKIGDYISVIDNRNSNGNITKLIGISIDKCYIPSVANVIGTDLKNYKVIRKGQFACSLMQVSRDQRIPLAMYTSDEPAIMSPAYVMFEVNRPDELLPEYMELWFKKAEFDREASFYAVGGVRGSLDWEDFCNMKLPVPYISEQRKIVHDYQVITDRIELLNKIIVNIDAQMRTYVKDWTRVHATDEGKLCDFCHMEYGFTETALQDAVGPKFLRITDITGSYIDWESVPYCLISKDDLEKYKLQQGDVVIARTGATSGAAKIIWQNLPDAVFASFLIRVIANEKNLQLFLGLCITDNDYYKYVQTTAEIAGSAQPQANPPLLGQYIISIPSMEDLPEFNKTVSIYLNYMDKCIDEISKLKSLQTLFLQKIIALPKGA